MPSPLLAAWTLVIPLLAQTTSPVELIQQPTPTAPRIAYGDDPLQFGELRVPAGKGPFPVVVLVHGGCWSAKLGKLPDNVVSYELLRPIAAALASAGIATWNVEYRRLGNEGGGWPGTYQDLMAATDHLRTLAPAHHLDLSRVISLGHSSGGQLAFWLIARRKLPADSQLHTTAPLRLFGAVSVDGPPDLEADRAIEQSVCGSPVVTQFLGGTPAEVPSRYREGSSTGLLPTGVRQDLFVATSMGERWTPLFEAYAATATKAGDPLRLLRMEGAGHFDGINPQSPHWTKVLDSIRVLLSAR